MWKSAYVAVYQLFNWKMHGETLKFEYIYIYIYVTIRTCNCNTVICIYISMLDFQAWKWDLVACIKRTYVNQNH